MTRFLTLLCCLAASVSVALAQSADQSEQSQRIDQLVRARVDQVGQDRRPGIDEYTFCRRVYLDTIGRIPTIDELEMFIEDKDPDKRARLIRKLLHSKGYQSHWYNYWADLLRVKYVGDKLHHPGNYAQWIKESLRSNKRYDQMAHELINAGGPLYKPGNGATGFYARESMPLDHLANSVKTFLGLSIECAQCHDHPFDIWTQKDFYKLAAFSSKTHLRVDPTANLEKKYAKDRRILKNKSFDEWIVYRESVRVKHAAIHGNGTGFMRLPHDYQYDDGKPHEVMEANVLFGEMPNLNHKVTKAELDTLNHKNAGPPINSRESLADWMVSPDNPLFTKSIVNRLWHQVMGTELVGPLGSLSPDDMGPHPELTEELVAIMKASRYDLKRFLSVLFNSRTYQSSAATLNADGPDYVLDGPIVRRLSAEAIVDSFLSLKTEDPDQYVPTEFQWDGFTHFYEKAQKMNVQDFVDYSIKGPGRAAFQKREEKAAKKRNGDMGPKHLWRVSTYGHVDGSHEVAMLLGKSDRELIDGANKEPNIPQILYLMNGHLEHEITSQPLAYLHRKLEGITNPDQRMEVIWKAILGRLPKASERALVAHEQDDLIWALLNSNEFRFAK
ncbi:MAG: DUF1549 domain-containing protein [Planctomycetaceae bacterium]|nr:DUF1549 domain-containing protein [Planctomycetaceae bacterium]